MKKFNCSDIILLFIIVLAFILRVMDLGSLSLWLDEAVNVQMAEKSFFQWTFVVPPLYNIALHCALAFGKSEAVARFPSVIFGVLSIFAIYKIGLILYGKKEALISAFLLSISPTAIYYSRQATYYSLVFFLSSASIYFYLRMEEKPTNLNKILFLVFLVFAFYTHYFTLILLFVLIIFKLWTCKRDKKDIKETKSFFVLVGIYFLLIAPILLKYISNPFKNAGTSYITFASQTQISVNFMQEIINFLILSPVYEKTSILPLIIMGFVLYGVYSSLDYFENSITLLTFWLFLPLGFAAILTPFIANLQIRYLLFILPALFLILSRGIAAIPDRINHLSKKIRIPRIETKEKIKFNSLPIIFVLIIIALLTYPILDDYYNRFEDFQWRGTAEYLQNNAEDDSNIILVPGYNIIPFNYYYIENNKTRIIEYSTFNEFVNLTNQNNTYLVVTDDVFALDPNEVNKLSTFVSNNTKLIAQFPSVYIFKLNR